jgi:predicted hydrocarbon binding protein
MGELHDAVTALLDAFARGISAIRTQRERRKEERLPVDATQAAAETHLRKSLKRSRSDVREAYGRDLARHGAQFASGDGALSLLSCATV